jgi:hypothetical protein
VELPKNVEDKDSSSIILESPKKIVGSKDSSPIVTESPKKIVDSKDSSPIIAELPIDEANNGIACEKSADSEDSSPIIVESPKKIVGSKDSSPIIAESSKKIGSLAASKALTEVTRSPDIPPFSIDAMLGSSELNPEQIQSPRENIRQRKSQSPKKIPSANQDHDDSKELETTDTGNLSLAVDNEIHYI